MMRTFLFILLAIYGSVNTGFIQKAPTNISFSLLRGGPGAYGAPRGQGKTHSGVDIVANQSSMDKSTYSVYVVNSGTVAYAKMNGTSSTGYGYTIVIDHGDGNYSQYSHLATNASTGLVKLGDKVTAGQLIGYMADLRKNERSSGNVLAEVVKPYDKIQLHFECILNKTGLRSTTSLAIFHTGGFLTDPTKDLQNLSYKSF